MNKRKVLSILLLALITVTLAVSCSSNIDTPAANTEELAYVTFGNGHSRELGTSYLTEDYDEIFWFYTATKDDSYGTTGVTSAEKPVSASYNDQGEIITISAGLGGQVGPFSQGAWKFTLYAYKETSKATLVYKSGVVPVTLKGGDVKAVPVSVTTQGSTGTLEVKDAYFEWYKNQDPSLGTIGQGGGDAEPSIKFSLINSKGQDIATGIDLSFTYDSERFNLPNNTYNIPVGYYTGIVSVYLNGAATDGTVINNEGTPVYTQSFGVRIYGNATTYISGNMVEGVDSNVTFDVPEQEMVIFTVDDDGSRVLTVPVSPKGATAGETTTTTTKKTEVSFPAGALDTTAVHQLDVKVTPTASAEQKFQVSGTTQTDGVTRTAVAGIDLTMVKVQKNADGSTQEVNVTNFNNQAVTITTYIATGLSGVEVKYLNGNTLDHIAGPITNKTSESTVPYYNPETGKLIFETSHFSQYVVVSPVEAVNVNTGVPYTSLATAIADAKDGQEVKVMKDIIVSEQINLATGVTIDGNYHTIEASDNATWSTDNGSKMLLQISSDSTVRNVTLDSKNNACGVQVYAATGVKLENVTLKNSKNAGLLINASQVVVSGKLTMSGNSWGNYINLGWGSNVQNPPTACTLDLVNATLDGINNIWTDSTDLSNARVNQDTWGNKFAVNVKGVWVPLKQGTGIVVVPEVKIGDKYYVGLPEAISAAQSGDTIELGEGVFYSTGKNTSPNTNSNKIARDINIVGSDREKTVIRVGSADFETGEHGGDYAFDGEGTITFKDLTLKDNYNDNANFRGYIRPGKMVLENCNVSSLFTYWGSGDVKFTNCNFSTPDYCITLYSGTSFIFENCTFTSAGNSNETSKIGIGKFINAYREAAGGNNPIRVTIEECKFITPCTKSYQAICLKGYNNNAWDVLIKDSSITVDDNEYRALQTSDSVNYNAVTNSSLYGLDATINVNTKVKIFDTKSAVDMVVWEKGKMVSID